MYNSRFFLSPKLCNAIAWKSAGSAAEISAYVVENIFNELKNPPVRVTLPDVPAPASRTLEDAYYINSVDIVNAVKETLNAN